MSLRSLRGPAQREPAPVRAANLGRNALRAPDRSALWSEARASAWQFLDAWVEERARVLVVGAGNGDDVPLAQLAARAARLDLLDLDGAALEAARGRLPRALRRRVQPIAGDATGGLADRVVRAVLDGRRPPAPPPEAPALGAGDYDLVIGDLLYTQLLYPALLDAGLTGRAIDRLLDEHGSALTRHVVARMHRSSRTGLAVHLHDAAGWWKGNAQPVSLTQLLALARVDPEAAVRGLADARLPLGADPRAALRELGGRVLASGVWRWPFQTGVDYLVVATAARA